MPLFPGILSQPLERIQLICAGTTRQHIRLQRKSEELIIVQCANFFRPLQHLQIMLKVTGQIKVRFSLGFFKKQKGKLVEYLQGCLGYVMLAQEASSANDFRRNKSQAYPYKSFENRV